MSSSHIQLKIPYRYKLKLTDALLVGVNVGKSFLRLPCKLCKVCILQSFDKHIPVVATSPALPVPKENFGTLGDILQTV